MTVGIDHIDLNAWRLRACPLWRRWALHFGKDDPARAEICWARLEIAQRFFAKVRVWRRCKAAFDRSDVENLYRHLDDLKAHSARIMQLDIDIARLRASPMDDPNWRPKWTP